MKKIFLLFTLSASMLFSQALTENISTQNNIDVQDPPENIKVDKMPSPASPIAPKYPDKARKLGVEAMVWLKLIVNEEGNAVKVEVFKSNLLNEEKVSGEGSTILTDFNNAAIEAAKQWKFTPAVLNGKSVKVWVTIPFKFKLSSEEKPKRNDMKYILRVESFDTSSVKVLFRFIYSFGNVKSVDPLEIIEKETPYEMEITSERFFGMIQEKSLKGKVKVLLTGYKSGEPFTNGECYFLTNIIQIDGDKFSLSK